jgi:hypothetical protein
MSGLATGTTDDTLLRFLARLDEHRLPYALASARQQAIMVRFARPGERWEVEVLADGTIEVERFLGDGTIADETAFGELWARLEGEADGRTRAWRRLPVATLPRSRSGRWRSSMPIPPASR